jgi:CubicO group peptidase (beta-lactamase class C family)
MRVFFLCLLLAMKIHAQQNADGILVGSMHSGGIDSLSIQRIEAEIQNGTYPNIHSLLIARHNNLVYEHYWPGKDEILGNDLGIVTHDRDSLHDIRSVTKSFVATCIGIALGQGRIKSIDQKVLSFFPEYAQLDTGMKSSLTIRHLLTMSSGAERRSMRLPGRLRGLYIPKKCIILS